MVYHVLCLLACGLFVVINWRHVWNPKPPAPAPEPEPDLFVRLTSHRGTELPLVAASVSFEEFLRNRELAVTWANSGNAITLPAGYYALHMFYKGLPAGYVPTKLETGFTLLDGDTFTVRQPLDQTWSN